MVIIETPLFTKRITESFSDEEYSELQWTLIVNPESGPLITGGKGLRKIRWALEGKGKSGGLRVIYYYVAKDQRIYLIFTYKKSRQEDLTKAQLKQLNNYVKEGVL